MWVAAVDGLSWSAALEVATARIRTAGEGLGSDLQTAWSELAERRPEIGSVTSRHLAHPMAQPLVASPLWAAEAAGDVVERRVLEDVVSASALGYLHVRAHDDFFDEGSGEPHQVMMLGDALLARASALLAAHVRSPRFWSRYAELLVAYADAMLLERELLAGRRPYDAATFAAVLRRSGPLLIPGAAVLAIADEWHRAAAFEEVLSQATRALQLVNDLTNAPRDLANGNRTWVLHRLGATDEQTLARAMVTGFDTIIGEAKEAFAAATTAADDLGSAMARDWCEAAIRECTSRQERFYAAVFETPTPTDVDE